MIDDLRLSRENLMLQDLQEAAKTGGDLECRARQGETPVRPHRTISICTLQLVNTNLLTIGNM